MPGSGDVAGKSASVIQMLGTREARSLAGGVKATGKWTAESRISSADEIPMHLSIRGSYDFGAWIGLIEPQLPNSLETAQFQPANMATELGRVANAALRSARISSRVPRSLISAPSSKQGPSVALISSFQCLSINSTQQRYQSAWASPARAGRTQDASDSNITKPKTASRRAWQRPTTPEIPDPDSTLPAPALDDTDMVRDTQFSIGDLTSGKNFDELSHMTTKYPDIRCVPRTGRSIQVGKGADAARSFRLLNMQCAANRVKGDFQSQRFHERPGLKRKRLKGERWRKRFMKAFKHTCKRVDELRRQGW
ncbi:hypothetical protein AB5N19_10439 [Seiridium cardinale]